MLWRASDEPRDTSHALHDAWHAPKRVSRVAPDPSGVRAGRCRAPGPGAGHRRVPAGAPPMRQGVSPGAPDAGRRRW